MKTLEETRLQTLYEYKILDTGTERYLDDLTRVASLICKTEMAAISFIDRERVWVKSSFGLGMKQFEVDRNLTICQYLIYASDLLEICDTLKNDLSKNNPFIIGEPYIRFYAGIPLVADNGSIIGSVCVLGKSPQSLSLDQMEGLKLIGRQIISMLEFRKNLMNCKNFN